MTLFDVHTREQEYLTLHLTAGSSGDSPDLLWFTRFASTKKEQDINLSSHAHRCRASNKLYLSDDHVHGPGNQGPKILISPYLASLCLWQVDEA